MTRQRDDNIDQSHSIGGSDESVGKTTISGNMERVVKIVNYTRNEITININNHFNDPAKSKVKCGDKNEDDKVNTPTPEGNVSSPSLRDLFVGHLDFGVNINGINTTLRDSSNILFGSCNIFTLLNLEKCRTKLKKNQPYHFSGSITGLNYRGKSIGLSTRHQTFIDGHDRQQDVCVNYCLTNTKKIMHCGTGLVYFDDQYKAGISDQNNICLFDFSKHADEYRGKAEFEKMFFNLDEKNILLDSDDVMFYSTAGYLDIDQEELKFDESGTLIQAFFRGRQFWCSPETHSNPFLGKCKQMTFLDQEIACNGIEGSPVFAFLYDNDTGLHVKFAGMNIQTGSWNKKEFEFIKANDIKYLLDNMIQRIEEEEKGDITMSIYVQLAAIICDAKDVEKSDHIDCKITAPKSNPDDVNIGKAVSILKNQKGLDIELKYLDVSKKKGVVSVIPSSLTKSGVSHERKGRRYIFTITDSTPAVSLDGLKFVMGAPKNPGEFSMS